MSGQRKSEGSIGELIGLIIMIGVGLVAITALTPAFLFVSILDVLINLKQGPLWGLTVFGGLALFLTFGSRKMVIGKRLPFYV